MQDRRQEHRDRLVEVQQGTHFGVVEDSVRVAQVCLDNSGGDFVGEQGTAVGEDHRVVVDVDDAHFRVDLVRDFVHISGGGQAGADVEELADTGTDQFPGGTAQQHAAFPAQLFALGEDLLHGGRSGPVGGEVVLPAEEVVVDAGDAGDFGVDLSGEVGGIGCLRFHPGFTGHGTALSPEGTAG